MNGYAYSEDTLILEFDNPCAYLDQDTIVRLNIDYYPYKYVYNQVVPFENIQQNCMVKINGVEKLAQCLKVSDKEIHISNLIGQSTQDKKIRIEIQNVKVHPITTLVQAELYNGQVDTFNKMVSMTQWNIESKVPQLTVNHNQVDLNSTANANLTSLLQSEVHSGIEYGAINFVVNSEVLRLASSFTVKITDMSTLQYSYGTVSLNSLGEGSLLRVYPFDLKNQVKFEYFFPFSQNQVQQTLKVYAHLLEKRTFEVFGDNPLYFEYRTNQYNYSEEFKYSMSNLFIGGKNRMTFEISQDHY